MKKIFAFIFFIYTLQSNSQITYVKPLATPVSTGNGGTGLDNSTNTAGSFLRSNGANGNFTKSTMTLPNTITANCIPVATSSNTIGQDNFIWDYVNKGLSINNGTLPAGFLYVSSTVTTSGTYANDFDPSVIIGRTTNSVTATNAHSFVDATIFTRSGKFGFNSFTANAQIIGTQANDHFAAFQSQFNYNGTGLMDTYYGFADPMVVNTGTITNVYKFHTFDGSGAGSVTNQYGFYVPTSFDFGTSSNYGFYNTDSKSYFGGQTLIGVPTTPANATNLVVQRSANLVNSTTNNLTVLYFEESGSNEAFLARYNSTLAGNFTGTTVAFANTFHINSGSSSNQNVVMQGNALFAFSGSTATNMGYNLTSAGVKIDQMQNLQNAATYALDVSNGNVGVGTIGNGIRVKEGTNAKQGVATLVGGTVTVSNTSVTANSRIMITVQSLGTIAVPVSVAVTGRTAGTSFTITSASGVDTSIIAWEIFEPY